MLHSCLRVWHQCPRSFSRAYHLNPFKILFLGRDEFSCAIFARLHASPDVWDSITVATHPDTRVGRSPLRTLAESANIPVTFIPEEKPDFKHWEPPSPFLDRLPNHLLITASFGRILTPSQLDRFAPDHRLNVHGSVLPAYRGPAPIQHAILDGVAETGVSVVRMLKRGVDKGPVWRTASLVLLSLPPNIVSDTSKPVLPSATFISLRDELAEVGGKLLVDVLRDMKRGTAISTPQPPETSTKHASAITTADAIRVLTTWLQNGIRLQLHDPFLPPSPLPAHYSVPSSVPGSVSFAKPLRALLVRCADNSLVAIPRVKKEKKPTVIEAREFWNGALPSPSCMVDGEVRFRMADETHGKTRTFNFTPL
ncbi:hypothetical protein MIND_00126200 [Mycena indigotica]|uniref:methionyl-tRNA formyltransferase n=1 Tax=Mycena indigotica TaxID=2126181 RepID=A0A8H6WFT0_9AGAR|nr:uncharacterized protein MIND_00126200 [Mycena indigotica]KAF7316082.1 hypothetical protein MIND_00126200 [Mycena indigotica]